MGIARTFAVVLFASSFAAGAADSGKVLRTAFSIAESSFDPVLAWDAASDAVIEHIEEPMLDYEYLARPVKLAPRTVEIPMSKFMTLLREDKVERLSITDREIRGILKPGESFTLRGGPKVTLLERLREAGDGDRDRLRARAAGQQRAYLHPPAPSQQHRLDLAFLALRANHSACRTSTTLVRAAQRPGTSAATLATATASSGISTSS